MKEELNKACIVSDLNSLRMNRARVGRALMYGIDAILGNICRKIDNISDEVGDVENEEVKDKLDTLAADCVWKDKYAGAVHLLLRGYESIITEQFRTTEGIIESLLDDKK